MKHPNNPYDRADSYRVAVAVRNKHGPNDVEGKADSCGASNTIPTSNIFARIVYWFMNLGNRFADPEDLELLKKDFEIDDHKLTTDEFLMKYGTDPKKGFTQNKALELLSRLGPNNVLINKDYTLLPSGLTDSRYIPFNFIKKSLWCGSNGNGIIIWLMVALSFVVYRLDIFYYYRLNSQYLFIGLFLAALNFTNGAMIYLQKKRLTASLKPSFSKILPKQCKALRGGSKIDILTEEVVVGDIIEVRPGDLIPADMRLIDSLECLKVDPFNLVGSHDIQIKHPAFQSNDPLLSPNMIFASTKIIDGVGRGVVTATANKTVIGRIVTLAEKMIKIEVPLSEEVRDLTCFKLPVYTVLLAMVVLIAGRFFMEFTWIHGLAAVLTISIACVPESFYITLTASMALNRRFNRVNPKDGLMTQLRSLFAPKVGSGTLCNVNFENLESVETMGALTTLLLDESSLFVDEANKKISYLWYDGQTWASDPVSPHSIFYGNLSNERKMVHNRNETWHMLSRVALCCNPHLTNSRKTLQELYRFSPMDLGILNYMESLQNYSSKVRDIYRKVADVPTKNPHILQMSIHLYDGVVNHSNMPSNNRNWRHYAFIRGHPLYLLQICSSVCIQGRETLLTEDIRRSFIEAYEYALDDHSNLTNESKNNPNDSKSIIAFAEARLSHSKFPRDFDFLRYFSQAALHHQVQYQSSKGSSFNYGGAAINIHSTLNSYNMNISTDGTLNDSTNALAGPETDNESYLFEDMDFKLVGLIGFRAPSKYNVQQTKAMIHKFKNSGIKVIMLTSQPKDVAKRLAKGYGIFDENSETVQDIADKLNVTIDKIDPSEANCHIIDCEDLKNMSYSEIDNTISSFLYDQYSTTGTLASNKTSSLATILASSNTDIVNGNPSPCLNNGHHIGAFPSNFQIIFCNNTHNQLSNALSKSTSTILSNTNTGPWLGTLPAINNVQILANLSFSATGSAAINESQNKLRLIESFQRLGDVIAVTGKTTSDCIPLKRCDIGISLSNANDVANHAADICLKDDHLSLLLDLVQQGRVYYDNLKKSLAYIMASNMCQIVALLVFVLLNIPLPLGIFTILWIDLGTDLIISLALFNERPEGNVLRRKPRDIYSDKLADMKLFKKSCLFVGLIEAFAGFLVYFVIMAENGFKPWTLIGKRVDWHSFANNDLEDSYGQNWDYQRRLDLQYACHSGFFLTIVIIQIVYACLGRYKYRSVFKRGIKANVALLIAIASALIISTMLVYIPGLNHFFGFHPLKIWWILPALPFALFLVLYDEFRKFLIRRDPDCTIARETLY